MPVIHKDRVLGNTHPLNVIEVLGDSTASVDEVTRPPLYEVYMRMAEELAKRSTCARLQVGTVLTDARLEHVVSIGYNGNARGFANRCDSDQKGRCGCIHSEMNALVKSPGQLRDKVAFVTASPCVMCAKLMVQTNVSHVFYRTAYRDTSGLEVLDKAGIVAVHYTLWKDLWRDG
ncbi:MAG: deaminase [Gemmatimonadota bacterium]|nr:deaminase [Gemmatimonadota bacterium]MDH3421383.1 deaminase [Gemmatimonadota bacterium]